MVDAGINPMVDQPMNYEHYHEMKPLMNFISWYFKFRKDKISVLVEPVHKNGNGYIKSITIINKELK